MEFFSNAKQSNRTTFSERFHARMIYSNMIEPKCDIRCSMFAILLSHSVTSYS